MKNYSKTSKWLRFIAVGAFGLMLVLNIMVSLDFDKDRLLPSLTLVELGNKAFAMGENGCLFTPGQNTGTCLENVSGNTYNCVEAPKHYTKNCSGD